MAAPNGKPRPAALEEFIAGLRRLREQAGKPSFRRMAARSGAISHATLHLTLTGHRLQPWATVREFVRACGGDEAEWHARWERTRLALSGDGDGAALGSDQAPEPSDARTNADGFSEGGPGASPEPGSTEGPATDSPPLVPADHSGDEPDGNTVAAGRWQWFRRLRIPLSAGLAVVTVATAVWLFGEDDPAAGNRRYSSTLHPGDASDFLADVTIPDGTVVRPNQQFVKTWKLRNSGTLRWRDRYLQRIDLPIRPNDCQTPERIPINDTVPQQEVIISVDVRAPPIAPAECKVHWKMVDESGQVLLPGYRPVYFEVRVRSG